MVSLPITIVVSPRGVAALLQWVVVRGVRGEIPSDLQDLEEANRSRGAVLRGFYLPAVRRAGYNPSMRSSLWMLLFLIWIVVDFSGISTPGLFVMVEDAMELLHRDRQREIINLAPPTDFEELQLSRPFAPVSRLQPAPMSRVARWIPVPLRPSGSAPPAAVGSDDH